MSVPCRNFEMPKTWKKKSEIKSSATRCPSIHPYSSCLLVYSFPLKSFIYFYCVCFSCVYASLPDSSFASTQLNNSTTRQLDSFDASGNFRLESRPGDWWKTSDENRNSKVEHGVQIWLLEIFEHFRKVCAYLIWSISLNQVGHGYLISKMMQLSLMCLNKIQEIHVCSAS